MVEAEATHNQGLDVWSDRLEMERLLWNDACLAADIFVQLLHKGDFEPAGLLVKAQAGPVRDIWLNRLTAALSENPKLHTIPHRISPDRLVGGLDLTATLTNGRKVYHQGLLVQADQQAGLLPSADLLHGENLRQILAAHDNGAVNIERDGVSDQQATRFGIIAFDESSEQGSDGSDEQVHPGLRDRLTLHINLNEISIRSAQNLDSAPQVDPAEVSITTQQIEEICTLCVGFGLTSLRPAMQAATLAKQIARIDGRTAVSELDIQIAIRLGLLNRATQLPAPPEPAEEALPEQEQQPDAPEQEPVPEQPEDRVEQSDQSSGIPDDINLDALASALPPGLLNLLRARLNKGPKPISAGRRGVGSRNNHRGRPLTSRRGDLGNGRRLDILATLRAAAPWQKLYGDQSASASARNPIRVRRSDLHVRQFKQRSETSSIFVVDASGSTAINRLAEAKGAVELLLGASYARRDHVALVSFRGRQAEVLLPPTRALVRAKRALAALPGGGGTPLASGLKTALQLAEDEWRKGRFPSLILLTDGSANVDASGQGNRAQAAEDAQNVARLINASGFETLLIDVGRQQRPQAKSLAANMGAHYVPMPQASANSISDMVKAHRR